MFGWFDKKARLCKRAEKAELRGDLPAAAELYLEAERPAEAARVLLLAADAELDPQRRLGLCAQAARVDPDGAEGRTARQRKAAIGFDLVKAAGGANLPAETSRIAAELEACEHYQLAAEAYRLVGDGEGEIRALKEGGLIEALERRLADSSELWRHQRDKRQLLRGLDDLDLIGERRKAIAHARGWLAQEPDEEVQLRLDRIRGKLARGPLVDLCVVGRRTRFALGDELTIGRSDATIVAASGSISRQHLRVFRDRASALPHVEDLGTRNGTMLAGARISGSLPVRQGLELSLAGQVACELVPLEPTRPDGPLLVKVAGDRYVAPLGPMPIGPWRVFDAHDAGDRFVVVETPHDRQPPHQNGYRLAYRVELCTGDELCETRDGPVVLAVPRE